MSDLVKTPLLEKLETAKVTEFDFYSKIVKEMDISKEVFSENPNDFIMNVDDFEFERFICLTGETYKYSCQLMIDRETGYLYSPKWFNKNRIKGNIEACKNLVSQIDVGGIRDWAIPTEKEFEKSFGDFGGSSYFINTDFSNTFYLNANNCYVENDEFYINLLDICVLKETDNYLNKKKEGNHKITSPFIFNKKFVSLNIWGENFTKEKFIIFLKENNFTVTITAKNFSFPKTSYPLSKKVPTILKSLEQDSGIALHTEKIVFPHQLFNSVSEISKYENLIKYIDFLLFKIESFSEKSSELLNDVNSVNEKLKNLKTKNVQLQKIQKYLLIKFDFSFHNLETKLIQYKDELIENLENVDSQTIKFFEDKNSSVFDFAPKILDINFNLFGETLTRLYNNQIDKINNFSDEVDFTNSLFEKIENFSIASENLVTGQKEKLRNDSEAQYIEDEFEKIFSEWSFKIDEIESQYFPIIQSYFNMGISQSAILESLSLLENYRNLVDNFFQENRISLIVQYDGNPKSDFLQKIEIEKNMFESCSIVRNGMREIIEKESNHLTKKALNSQSETLLNNQFSNIAKIVKNLGLSQDIQSQFYELTNQNFETNLSDAVKYSEELEKRDKDILGLMFRMKKDVAKMDIQKLTQSYENSNEPKLIEQK